MDSRLRVRLRRPSLWQGRFASFVSFVMDEPHPLAAAAYTERNPVKAGLVEQAEEWPWSSARPHVSGKGDGVPGTEWLTDMTVGWVCTWREYLRQDEESGLGGMLRRHDSTTRPLGAEPFVPRISALVGRRLLRRKPGPKPKKGNRKASNWVLSPRNSRICLCTLLRSTQHLVCDGRDL